jgi:hypothetical protein
MNEHIPERVIKRSTHDKPWFTDDCAIACDKKNKAYKKYRASGTDTDKQFYKKSIDTAQAIYKRAQEQYKIKIEHKLIQGRDYPKIWWNITKHVAGFGGHSDTPTLVKGNIFYETATEKAELLNGIFADKATLDDEGRHPPAISQKCYKQLNKIKFRAKVISRKLKKLDPSKATGPDDIPALVLKHCSSSLGKPLAALFKLSFNIGCIPQEWKNANVVPVFKAGDKSDPNNYRPISLLCIISKIMETIINDSLRKHLFNMKLLSSRQHGFQPGKSTIDLLTHTTQNWLMPCTRVMKLK